MGRRRGSAFIAVIQIVHGAYSGYHYVCGAMTPPGKNAEALPEVLHFYP